MKGFSKRNESLKLDVRQFGDILLRDSGNGIIQCIEPDGFAQRVGFSEQFFRRFLGQHQRIWLVQGSGRVAF